MKKEMHTDIIAGIVSDALSAEFNVDKLIDVKVVEDTDSDGDRILRITVVFDGSRKALGAKDVSSAVRRIRPKLSAEGYGDFPIFSFVSSDDPGWKRVAAA